MQWFVVYEFTKAHSVTSVYLHSLKAGLSEHQPTLALLYTMHFVNRHFTGIKNHYAF